MWLVFATAFERTRAYSLHWHVLSPIILHVAMLISLDAINSIDKGIEDQSSRDLSLSISIEILCYRQQRKNPCESEIYTTAGVGYLSSMVPLWAGLNDSSSAFWERYRKPRAVNR